ncbi:MAG: MFS transporter [Acidimicrobiaceae bacterium]|nr:MFS transporter [Acidimicrobiaceae bacterium]
MRNDFLKDEREFSAAAISLFTVVTNTPIGIGILAGGYLADRRGRRPVGAAGLVAGAVFAAWAYFTDGAALWSLTLAGGVLGAVAVPALAVYGPELFGTYRRGRANGLIVTVGVAGSALGLLVAGWLSDSLDGRLGPALALLAVGPLAVAALVVWKYPETAGLELEDLNPEDREPGDPLAG